MSRGNTSVDMSAIQQCENKVDASFRRIRLSRTKFKKNQSDAKESYVRKILDVHRKSEARERLNAYNKRLHLKRPLRQPLSSSSSQKEDVESQPKPAQSPIDERLSDSKVTSSSGNSSTPPSPTHSDFASSPYKRSPIRPFSQSRSSALKKHLTRETTNTILRVDDDIQQDYKSGRITKGQYHKLLLFRNKMIYCMCLEDLDGKNCGGKGFETVEKERIDVEKQLNKIVARYPKAYASLHPRTKVVTSKAYSIAFRPHREERPRGALTAKSTPRVEASPEKEEKIGMISRSSRQQYFVTTRPGTAGGSLGGGTSLRTANPKHGGRLSSQNLVNYLLNRSTHPIKSSLSPHPPTVRTAVQKARQRVLEERSRSIPRGESIRLKNLYQIARSRQSRVGSNSYLEVGLDIPSKLPSPRESEASESRRDL